MVNSVVRAWRKRGRDAKPGYAALINSRNHDGIEHRTGLSVGDLQRIRSGRHRKEHRRILIIVVAEDVVPEPVRRIRRVIPPHPAAGVEFRIGRSRSPLDSDPEGVVAARDVYAAGDLVGSTGYGKSVARDTVRSWGGTAAVGDIVGCADIPSARRRRIA